MIQRSKRDGWLVLVLAFAILFPLAIGLCLLIATPARLAGVLLIGVGVAVGILIYWLINPLYYEIAESKLRVRAGPMRWTIPLDSIDEVYPTRNALSSPALSLDRLLIKYVNGSGRRALMISPEDQPAFLKALTAAEPRLKFVGNSLKSLVQKTR